MIKIKLELVYPYSQSLFILLDFCKVHKSRIISAGTYRQDAVISMPNDRFFNIFGSDPVVKKYPVPHGAERFTKNCWEVTYIY